MGTFRNGSQTCRELADVCRIVVFFDMLTAAGNGDGIEHLEEVEREHIQQVLGCSLAIGKVGPMVILHLGRTEDFFDGPLHIEFVVNQTLVALVGQLQLILQVVEAIVHWRSTQHQHLRTHTSPNHLVHQTQIAVFTWVLVILIRRYLAAIAEVMAFVNDNQVVVAPVQ